MPGEKTDQYRRNWERDSASVVATLVSVEKIDAFSPSDLTAMVHTILA